MEGDTLRADCVCGHRLWARRRGEMTLASKILRYGPDGFTAKCPRCGESVPVPFLRLEAPVRSRRRLVVRVDRMGAAGQTDG